MGFLTALSSQQKSMQAFPGANLGQSLWRQVFGTVSRNDTDQFPKVVPGGSYGRSSVSGANSYRRLLQAMRSMSPGGWSDNRWEQWKHWVGIAYIAGHRSAEAMAQSEFAVYIK